MMMLGAMNVASLAALLVSSLSGMAEWPVIPWIKIEGRMELMTLWIKEVLRFDVMIVSHKDLLFVQKRMVIEEWLTLVDFQVKTNSIAAAFSS